MSSVRRASAMALVTAALCWAPAGAGAVPAPAYLASHHRDRPPQGAGAGPTPTTAAAIMPVPTPPAAAPEDTCVPGTWQSAQGAPAAYLPGLNAAYLWHDADGGWALRVTHPSDRAKAVFSGSLSTTTGQFVQVAASPGTGNDIVYLSADRRTVYFRFVNFGLLDGLDFATHCARALVLRVHLGAADLPPEHIFVGANGTHPPRDPFKVARSAYLEAVNRHLPGPAPKG